MSMATRESGPQPHPSFIDFLYGVATLSPRAEVAEAIEGLMRPEQWGQTGDVPIGDR